MQTVGARKGQGWGRRRGNGALQHWGKPSGWRREKNGPGRGNLYKGTETEGSRPLHTYLHVDTRPFLLVGACLGNPKEASGGRQADQVTRVRGVLGGGWLLPGNPWEASVAELRATELELWLMLQMVVLPSSLVTSQGKRSLGGKGQDG